MWPLHRNNATQNRKLIFSVAGREVDLFFYLGSREEMNIFFERSLEALKMPYHS